jgi:hypothetical protein
VADVTCAEWGWTATKPMVYDDPDTIKKDSGARSTLQ